MTSNHKTEKAFVLGYTGATGKQIVKLLLEKKLFKQVVLIGRRKVDFGGDARHVEQTVVDFDKIFDYQSAFEGCSTGFCCLGSRAVDNGEAFHLAYFKDASQSTFYRVDHDYIVNCATVTKRAGCKSFSLVSGQMANKGSWIFAAKIKGLVEQELTDLGFGQLSIFRPSMILADDRDNAGFLPWFLLKLAAPFMYMWPKDSSIRSEQLAKAMIWNACFNTEERPKSEIVYNAQMYDLSEAFDKDTS